jgi:hypothetical protein
MTPEALGAMPSVHSGRRGPTKCTEVSGMITIRVCQQAPLSCEARAIISADTGSLNDSSATTKSGLAAQRYKCQFAARSACSFDGG